MAIEYFCCYHSYLEMMELLNDAERGRLFVACLMYSKSGEVPELRGNERFVFPAFRSQIDRDMATYEAKCKKQSKNAKKRWDATACDGMPRDAMAFLALPNDANQCQTVPSDANSCQAMPTHANNAKEKEKEKEKEKAKEKENIPPNPPKGGTTSKQPDEAAEIGRLPAILQPVMREWLEYKRQRREKYTPVGLTALISEVLNNAGKYGDAAVAQIVRTSMASGYKGIVFDRLQNGKTPVAVTGGAPTDWAKAAVARMMQEGGT